MSHTPLTFFISGADVAWMRGANCRSVDPDLFHQDEWTKRRGLPAEVPPDVSPICGACDVRLTCLDWALKHDEHGVWGGTTRQQREAMKRPIVRARCPACQSNSLFRAGPQQVCGDCGTSWEATRIHGHARATVEHLATDIPLPLHPGNVIRLPINWGWEQITLFDASPFRMEKQRRTRCSRKRRPPLDQLPLPGLAEVVTMVAPQVRTRPTAPVPAVAA